MKKQLLSAVALCGMLFAANAQTTNSEVSGNAPTALNEGYEFLFNVAGAEAGDPNVYNCMSVEDDKYNVFANPNYTVTLNQTAQALSVAFTTSESDFMSNRLQKGNCLNATIVLTDTYTDGITALVTSSVDLPKLTIGVAVNQAGVGYQLADENLETVSLAAGVEKLVKFSIPQNGFFGGKNQAVSLDKTIGWFLQAKAANATDAAISGTLTIKEIQIGDAVTATSINTTELPSTVNYYPNPSNSVINVTNVNVSSLKVLDMNGLVVRTSTASNVSVEGLASGLYFLQINEFKPVKVMVK